MRLHCTTPTPCLPAGRELPSCGPPAPVMWMKGAGSGGNIPIRYCAQQKNARMELPSEIAYGRRPVRLHSCDTLLRHMEAPMRAVLTIVFCLGVASPCLGQGTSIERALKDQRDREAVATPAPKQRLKATEAELWERTTRPLAAFLSDQKATCSHPAAREAEIAALATMVVIDPARHGLARAIRSGDAVLQVADAYRDRGCPREARRLYDEVLKVFTGTAYASLRDRAKVGIDDLRSIR